MATIIQILIIAGALLSAQGTDSNGDVSYDPEPPAPTALVPNITTAAPPQPTTTPTKPTSKPPSPPPTPPPTTQPPTTQPPTPPTKPPTKPPTPPTKPPTPPTKPPTPSPAPEPPKPIDPTQGSWNYSVNTNVTCIKMQFAMQIVVPYLHKSRNSTYNATIDIPVNATVKEGDCGNDTEHIEIQWQNFDKTFDTVKFLFETNASTKHYQLQEIDLAITPDFQTFPGIDDTSVISLNHKSAEFVTNLLNSYKCEKEQHLNLTDSAGKQRGFIKISHLQLQAFGTTNNTEFLTAVNCESSTTPDVVPIAVGCSLAILVIVVLVAYLIGRKRRQARGYLSM